jgi:hypothetical protein
MTRKVHIRKKNGIKGRTGNEMNLGEKYKEDMYGTR